MRLYGDLFSTVDLFLRAFCCHPFASSARLTLLFATARAFVFRVANSRQQALFVCADLGQVTLALTERVLEMLVEKGLGCYHEENTTITATHTHCGPGGLSHYTLYNAHPPLTGFHSQNFDCVAEGIVRAVVMAHEGASPGRIRLAQARLAGASVQRSPESYGTSFL